MDDSRKITLSVFSAIAMMFVRLCVRLYISLSVWDRRALWSYTVHVSADFSLWQ